MHEFIVPMEMQYLGTALFAIAVCHTFVVNKFLKMAERFPHNSFTYNVFHFLGEVEAVFGIWSAVFIMFYTASFGFAVYDESHHHVIEGALGYLESRNFTEPAFVFVIMCMAATRPVIVLAESVITYIAKLLPLKGKMSFYVSILIIGPLLGSFITEPAAMTLSALILLENFYEKDMSQKFKYATLGLLFVNISVGGTLTHFAAPPVLMVAAKWGWGIEHMLFNFGYKAVIAVVVSTAIITFLFRKDLAGDIKLKQSKGLAGHPTWWIILIHCIFLALVVFSAHHIVFFLGLFLFFLGFVAATNEFQDTLKLKESLLVGFFLAGLVVLGGVQGWWLQTLITQLGDFTLFIGATALTAVTDNAALTYLGTLVELSDSQKYNLVAGAVTGGGLTVIANAPNPAGFGILKDRFGEGGINPLGLLKSALLPTFICVICFNVLV